jgi:hypothetical protein
MACLIVLTTQIIKARRHGTYCGRDRWMKKNCVVSQLIKRRHDLIGFRWHKHRRKKKRLACHICTRYIKCLRRAHRGDVRRDLTFVGIIDANAPPSNDCILLSSSVNLHERDVISRAFSAARDRWSVSFKKSHPVKFLMHCKSNMACNLSYFDLIYVIHKMSTADT